jgi:hypothetical protein
LRGPESGTEPANGRFTYRRAETRRSFLARCRGMPYEARRNWCLLRLS